MGCTEGEKEKETTGGAKAWERSIICKMDRVVQRPLLPVYWNAVCAFGSCNLQGGGCGPELSGTSKQSTI